MIIKQSDSELKLQELKRYNTRIRCKHYQHDTIPYEQRGNRKTKVSLPTLIAIANALSVSVDTLLCDNVLSSKVIFEKEAKDIFSDCDEYEIRSLVELLKSAKTVIRKDREIRKQFEK